MSSTRGPKMSKPTHDEVYKFVQQNDCPFVTSGDVAQEFDQVSERTIRERLNDLVDNDRLACRRVGAHAKVWYLPTQRSDSASSVSPSSLSQ